jgi:hypothetical protein
MIKHNQNGAASGITITLILTIVLLIGTIVFGVWAFMGRQDYKNNTDAKIQAAVKVAVAQEGQSKDSYYAQQAKFPLAIYDGPAEFGSIVVYYPKTWSAYVDDTGSGSTLIDGYFSPGHVPSLTAPTSEFALRVRVVDTPYSQVIQGLNDLVKAGQITSSAYTLPKLPSQIGVEINGALNSGSKTVSTEVLMPIRSNTLEVSTDGTQFLSDFNQNVLPYLSFSP